MLAISLTVGVRIQAKAMFPISNFSTDLSKLEVGTAQKLYSLGKD